MTRAALLISMLWPIGCVFAGLQPAEQEQAPARGADGAVEQYLSERGLDEILEAQLRQRLTGASGPERSEIAERLSEIYARQLEQLTDQAKRAEVERLARDLLARVDPGEARLLRLAIELARYRRLESLAERHRVGMLDAAELDGAVRELAESRDVFAGIAGEARRRVETFEREERRARGDDRMREVAALLADARALRSRSTYFAAWAGYYLSVLTGNPSFAASALDQFGEILNAEPGSPPSIERFPESLLRLEHVARSCIGVAMCFTLRGDRVIAVAWLDLVESGAETPASVRSQVFSWRLASLIHPPGRWAEVERAVRIRLNSEGPDSLSTRDARMLAIAALEQTGADPTLEYERRIRTVTEVAFGTLAERGEIAQLTDLISRFPNAPIPGAGFIGGYIEGVRLMERAESLQSADQESADPSRASGEMKTLFDRAAEAFARAIASPDAGVYPQEIPRCYMRMGFALFGAARPGDAADAFERALEISAAPAIREEAMWNAIISLERLLREKVSADPDRVRSRLERLASLYIAEFPRSERAVRLLIRRSGADTLPPREAVELLLSTPMDSPIRAAAEERAAGLLYQMFRSAPERDRPHIGIRFMEIAERAAERLSQIVRSETGDSSRRAASQATLLLRQVAGVALESDSPDPDRALRAIDLLERVAQFGGIDLSPYESELLYRRLQIGVLTGQPQDRLDSMSRAIRAGGGPFAAAADIFIYRASLQAWRRNQVDMASARSLANHGERLIRRWESEGVTLADPSLAGVYDSVIGACAQVWNTEQDEQFLSLGLRLARVMHASGERGPEALRRYAALAEASDAEAEALDAWRLLLAGASARSPGWYEARVETIRLLARSDPGRARIVLDQHKALEPELGPEPWRSRIRELDDAIPGRGAGR